MKDKLMVFGKDIDLKRTTNVLMLIAVFGGVFGFVYEELFYRIDLGYFVKRGSSFGPWIPIYAFGSLAITMFLYKYRKNPLGIFLFGTILTGIIEYVVGAFLFYVLNTRLWDYNTEIWNFGNINGFVCLRSVLFFGISGLFLIYLVIPGILKITEKISEKTITIISRTLITIFIIDIVSFQVIKLIK